MTRTSSGSPAFSSTPFARRLDPGLRAGAADSVVDVEATRGPARAVQGGDRVDRAQEERLQADTARIREHRLDERGRSRDVRGGHRRAVREAIGRALPRRVDVRARRGEVDRAHAVVREPGLAVELVARADGDDVRRVVARRPERLGVRVREVVARGRDEELAARSPSARSHPRAPGRSRRRPRVVHDRNALARARRGSR